MNGGLKLAHQKVGESMEWECGLIGLIQLVRGVHYATLL